MIVSVIIPKRKSEDITRITEAIEHSTFAGDYEYEAEVVIVNMGLERSKHRNVGIEISKGKYVFILDSDQMVSEDLIGECVYLMERHPECGGIYIPEKIMGTDWFSKLRNWERQFYNGTSVDVVRFVRAGCPLFDETMSGPEDSDWGNRIAGKKLISKNCLYHYDHVNFFTYMNKKAYYTKSMNLFAKKNPNDKCLNFRWRCFRVFLENGKWRRVIRRPDLMFLVWGLIFIRGIIYLWGTHVKK